MTNWTTPETETAQLAIVARLFDNPDELETLEDEFQLSSGYIDAEQLAEALSRFAGFLPPDVSPAAVNWRELAENMRLRFING